MSKSDQLFIFGSFSEDETKLFQKQAVEKVVLPPEMTYLQFGSLDVASISISKGLNAEKKKLEIPLSSSVHASKEVVEKKIYENGNASTNHDLKMISSVRSNGSAGYAPQLGGSTGEEQIVETSKTDENKFDHKEFGRSGTHHINHHKSEDAEASTLERKILDSEISVESTTVSTSGSKDLLPRGLINSGNLCFLNATLQALLSCTPFVRLLQDLRARTIPKIGYPTLNAFVEFIMDFDLPEVSSPKKHEASVVRTGPSFSPIMFDGVLKNFTPDLPAYNSSVRGGQGLQEDAQEFLSFIMDRMHDELLKLKGLLSNYGGSEFSLVSSAEDDGWETSFLPSELSDIFGGQTRSVVKSRGNKASATVEPFLLLHLDIFPDSVRNIEDALHLFSAPETLEGYKTLGGKAGEVSASKSVKIHTLSKVLILHLMRFSYGTRGSTKLHKPVHFFPELVLRRELLVSPSTEGRRYELVATITHHGREPSRGHYTADAKCSSGRWLRYDDASVTCVDLNKVLHDQAYILFYKQV
ncbi:unnamed protein product [Spirodela intermedia]|uniref:Ubiquitin carboxyl-terminal hydrolase n=1 Tax=Spirodela intermedia TaxID=51605 RepID=A0A7I8JFJ1_SPIIN|nr:unnamed protein product [Spirodela intermedia]CAA6668948.1 unnamed protein product [Spirodela intermedia]